MDGELAPDRTVLTISGSDREKFLHGLVTRMTWAQAGSGLVWSALLTAQGKYLADFFLLNRGDDILLDVKTDFAQGLAQRLAMYKLRADVRSPTAGSRRARPRRSARGAAGPTRATRRSAGGPMAGRGGSRPSTGTRSAWRPACRRRGSS
jgi:folate-binding Fe-S cluster repair protein YgfZ